MLDEKYLDDTFLIHTLMEKRPKFLNNIFKCMFLKDMIFILIPRS